MWEWYRMMRRIVRGGKREENYYGHRRGSVSEKKSWKIVNGRRRVQERLLGKRQGSDTSAILEQKSLRAVLLLARSPKKKKELAKDLDLLALFSLEHFFRVLTVSIAMSDKENEVSFWLHPNYLKLFCLASFS